MRTDPRKPPLPHKRPTYPAGLLTLADDPVSQRVPLTEAPPALLPPPKRKRGLLGNIGQYFLDRFAPVTEDVKSQLSRGDLAAVQRMGLGGADANAAGMEIIQRRQMAQQMAQRERLFAKYAPVEGEPQLDATRRLQALFTEASRLGDVELAGKLGEVLKSQADILNPKAPELVNVSPGQSLFDPSRGRSVFSNPAVEKPPELDTVDRGDYVDMVNPITGETIRSIKKGAAPRQPGTGTPGANPRIDRLATQYERETREAQEQYDGIGLTVANEVPKALARDGAAQYAVLVQFIRALDPGSVAREGEVALARKAQSIWDSVQTGLLRVQSGSLISTTLVQQMADLMKERQESYLRRMQRTAQKFKERANNPNDLDAAFFVPGGGAAVPPTGQFIPHGGAAPTGADVRKFLKPNP